VFEYEPASKDNTTVHISAVGNVYVAGKLVPQQEVFCHGYLMVDNALEAYGRSDSL
jgi:hypothetical protein